MYTNKHNRANRTPHSPPRDRRARRDARSAMISTTRLVSLAVVSPTITRARRATGAILLRSGRALTNRTRRVRASNDESTDDEPPKVPSRERQVVFDSRVDAPKKPAGRGKLDGGKYGMGTRIDEALDRSTDERGFLIGALSFTVGAVLLFILGPRPPTEY